LAFRTTAARESGGIATRLRGTNRVLRRLVMIATKQTSVLVSPTALALSMLHAGGDSHLPITIARSRLDFMRRALSSQPTVAVVGRGWLTEIDLRRLALRRVFSSTPRLLLVLGREETPTAFEWKYFDAVIVAGKVFMHSAGRLRHLVDNVAAPEAHRPMPRRPISMVA
jgi:hypothetical protein